MCSIVRVGLWGGNGGAELHEVFSSWLGVGHIHVEVVQRTLDLLGDTVGEKYSSVGHTAFYSRYEVAALVADLSRDGDECLDQGSWLSAPSDAERRSRHFA